MTRVHTFVLATYLSIVSVRQGSAIGGVAQFLDTYEKEASETLHITFEAAWTLNVNYTQENAVTYHQTDLNLTSFMKRNNKKAMELLHNSSLELTADETRQLTYIADMGTAAQPDTDKLDRLNQLETNMTSIYAKAEVCMESSQKCLKLDPGLIELMQKSRNCQELSEAWQKWRDESGRKIKRLFPEYVQLSNEAVRFQGHSDLGEYWRSKYDTPTFESDIARLWQQVWPLYRHLHSYVRRRLRDMYGPEVFSSSGHIPAHLLGNMWAQTWENVYELVKPFNDKHSLDTTQEMLRQNYTVRRMFETAEEFFSSLGFHNMTKTFWENSMFERPEDREVDCHASAWDMNKKDDYRIKMCTQITHEYLLIIHHEMGHIQYFMEYSHLPLSYRKGANPGFHEAVGDTISKSVQTPQHLSSIGLIQSHDKPDNESDINFLMQMALHNIAFLPFGYLIDQWRWSVFRGDTSPETYNEDWWKLRCKLQGVSAPVRRSSDDFDPGAKFHVAKSTPYVRYFVSFVIQYQFYKAACEAAGHTGPLYRCDFYNNKAAGHKIRSMLQLGASKPWPEAMEQITGQRDMDAGPLMEYFRPLINFLERENGEDVGWEEDCPIDPPPCPGRGRRLQTCSVSVLLLALGTSISVMRGRSRSIWGSFR